MPVGRHLTRGPEDTVRVIGPVAAMCWLAGWYFKDTSRLCIWFYFTPAVAMALFGLAWLAIARKRVWLPSYFFVMAVELIALYQIAVADMAWNRPQTAAGPTLRVAQWNTARHAGLAREMFRLIAKDHPDICVISESPRISELYELGQQELGMGEALDDQGMTIFSRFPLTPMGSVRITTGRASLARIATPQGPLDILAFDLISHPLLNREIPMRDLANWISRRRDHVPLIIAGDFNTMRDSSAFAPLRALMMNAYETAGRGWPYSWPVPLPVYAIDHVWVSADITVVSQTYKTSLMSDHRREIVDVSLPHSAGPSAAPPASAARNNP